MAISLANVKRVKSTKPVRGLIYGIPKIGKTELASEFPNPIFVQTEEGQNSTKEIATFGLLKSFPQVCQALEELRCEPHDFKTVVLDGLDKLEPLVWKYTCEANKWKDIEDPGYGKGYAAADYTWRELIELMNAIRDERNMNVVYIAHSVVTTFNDPRTTSYSQYNIRLHKGALGLIQDDVDVIAFVTQEPAVMKEKGSFGKERSISKGGNQRWIYLEGIPTIVAGNRYGMPGKIAYIKGKGYEALSKYLPSVNGGVQPQPEPDEDETQTADAA
jgi:hypothetical protein